VITNQISQSRHHEPPDQRGHDEPEREEPGQRPDEPAPPVGRHELRQERRDDRALRPRARPGQHPARQEHLVVRRERGDHGEDGVERQRVHHDLFAADAVTEQAGGGRAEQEPERRGGPDEPELAVGQPPGLLRARQQERDHGRVHAVEGVAEAAYEQQNVVRTAQREPVQTGQQGPALAQAAEEVVIVPAEGEAFFPSLTAGIAVAQALVTQLAAVDPARTSATIEAAESMWSKFGLLHRRPTTMDRPAT
jgi:hypothetical protein